MEILGIDIGGSGIKGAPVNIETGEFAQERYRLATPQPSKPEAVAETVRDVARFFNWEGPVGCTFPAIVKSGTMYSAANVDDAWICTNGKALFEETMGLPVHVLNDADAAGIAEMIFGAGRGHKGVVMMLTLGTGIGSAIFVEGTLVPNLELGHLEIRGKSAEDRASDRIRQEKDLSWEKWARRLNEYLQKLEYLFSPDLFIIGGGVSKRADKFFPLLEVNAEIVPAQLQNDAGIVGAALSAMPLLIGK